MHGTDAKEDVRLIQRIQQVTRILEVCCKITGMGFGAVARVTEERWLTCASLDMVGFGLKPGDELPLETTICNEIRQTRKLVVFDDAQGEEYFRDHHTPRIYGLRSYISVPIVLSDGEFFGTLCAIDSAPRRINTPEIVGMFELFADLIAGQIDNLKSTITSEQALAKEREDSRLREEFIAVVGHDLRNPVAAFASGLRFLERGNADGATIVREMKKSVTRMSVIISNLMDFARGRLGGGIFAERQDGVELISLIDDIVGELRSFSEHDIRIVAPPELVISCDPQRLGQLLSNLVGNAITHGVPGTPVEIEVEKVAADLRITVTNQSSDVPPEVLETAFKPFKRLSHGKEEGLGLGLYISSEIAKAHGGTLSAQSDDGLVSFTLTIPVDLGLSRSISPEEPEPERSVSRW
jgi:signal transduction histidine kinase